MNKIDYITVNDLYAYAKEHRLLDARLRICDGMAVSYYPDPRAVKSGRYEVVIDVSANTPVEYDELDEYALAVAPHDELDALAHQIYTNDRPRHNAQQRRDVEADRRREYLRKRQAITNAGGDLDSFPWAIYGYGRRK